MGKKKGKNTQQQEEERADDIVDLSRDKAKEQTAKGKKGKRKQYDEDTIEDDLMQIANEQGLEEPTKLIPEASVITGEPSMKENKSPDDNGGDLNGQGKAKTTTESIKTTSKKGKKKRSKKDDDWEEEIAEEIERLNLGDDDTPPVSSSKEVASTNKTLPDRSNDGELQPTTTSTATSTTTTTNDYNTGNDNTTSTASATDRTDNNEGEEEVVHIKTKAEKKAAKKEKQKESKKKKSESKEKSKGGEEPGATISPQTPATDTITPPTISTDAGVTADTPVNEEQEEKNEQEEEEEDDKKKKKKKKKKEEEKKGAKPTKKKVGLLKMKEEIEALRAAQKKREEEEREKQRKAEEEERQRLEKLRLEKERKEKKKQKEKERKERLKKEGKLLSKAEKEKRARQAIQMAALIEQGMIVLPQKPSGGSEGEKKPVRYGGRVRHKKKPVNADQVSESSGIETDPPSSAQSEPLSETNVTTTSDELVKDNWDDESDEEVKNNWDDSSEEEEEEEEEEEMDMDEEVSTPQSSTLDVGTGTGGGSNEEVEMHSSTSSDESESDVDSEDENEEMSPYEKASKRINERRRRHANERTLELLRSPVVCVLGHVDTGKTKILDKIRHTNVQDGEAGGITQQIGATFVPEDAVKEQTKCLKEFSKCDLKVPGLLIIDTPGHESFSNLRTRGSSMCDIAILVVDIMHGLEPQTIESLELLRKGKVPFVVALNKIDRMYDWRRNPTSGIRETLKRQKPNTKAEFDERTQETITQFAEKGLNAALFWEKVDFTEYIPLVPTSAISGDGMADLISQIVTYSEKYLEEKLMFSKEVEALVLEVKVIAGLGTTIDVILRNGLLNEGETMVLTGSDGPFVTQARALLMPQPLRELRVKNAYVNHKTVIASQGVKICGKDLEKTMAGTPVLIAKKEDEIEVLKNEAASMMSGALSAIKLKEKGVFVQASTLGSLEALLEFLKTSKIPYAGVNIGPVHRKDVMKASVMLERDNQWACILAFDVRVERDAQEMADSLGVRIFTADIIYHLFDNFTKYRAELKEKRRRENEHIATFPCKLRIIPNCIFNARNPIVVGVIIENGILKPGTPLCVPSKEFINVGTVTSLEINHKQVDIAHKGEEVCVKIEALPGEAPKLYGRHFTLEDLLVSKITRESIDAVKAFFREDLQKSDWQLMIELKKMFHIY